MSHFVLFPTPGNLDSAHQGCSIGDADGGKSSMPKTPWIERTSPAFRLMVATSWLAPESWRDRQDESIRKALGAFPDWTEYLLLVNRHRIPALSWAALKRVRGLELPDNAVKELRKRSDACRIRAMLHMQLLAGVLKAFNRAGIPVMPLKGPLLSIEIYGDAGIRQSKDLDILVPPDHLQRAQACLKEMDWLGETDDSTSTRRQSEFSLRHEHHAAYIHASQNCQLELHWRIAWDAPDLSAHRLVGSINSQWQGCFFQAMNPVDLTLFLCAHGSTHAWSRAKWLGDMARIYTCRHVDWRAVLEKARSVGQERPVLMCLRFLEEAHGLTATGLTDERSETLPSVLTDKAVRDLTAFADPCEYSALTFVDRVRFFDYSHLLWPKRSSQESFSEIAIFTPDFKLIHLPDWLFWLYVPLRPLLWAWRHVLDSRHRRFSMKRRNQRDHGLRSDRASAAVAADAIKN